MAITVTGLPSVAACADTDDNYLLTMASVGAADFLITGDKGDLLNIGRYEGTKIATVRDFVTIAGRMPKA